LVLIEAGSLDYTAQIRFMALTQIDEGLSTTSFVKVPGVHSKLVGQERGSNLCRAEKL
jgi:hypothetical protein